MIFKTCRMIAPILALLLVHFTITYAKIYPAFHDIVPISAKTWEEVDIAWYNKFNPKKPNYAHLLRSIRYIKQHYYFQGKHLVYGAASKSIRPNAIIMAVKPIGRTSLLNLQSFGGNAQFVTGLYVHETNNVRTYQFMNPQGQRSILHATPNHPFYVRQLHTFIPISEVSPKMALVGKAGEVTHLICSIGKRHYCGTPYHGHKATWVYNIEVYQDHIYRVGTLSIKVHNCNLPSENDQASLTYEQGGSLSPEHDSLYGQMHLSRKIKSKLLKKLYSCWGDYSAESRDFNLHVHQESMKDESFYARYPESAQIVRSRWRQDMAGQEEIIQLNATKVTPLSFYDPNHLSGIRAFDKKTLNVTRNLREVSRKAGEWNSENRILHGWVDMEAHADDKGLYYSTNVITTRQ